MWHQVGIGLAAPQVGIPLRLLVMDDGKGGTPALINPVITERSGTIERRRGASPCPASSRTWSAASRSRVQRSTARTASRFAFEAAGHAGPRHPARDRPPGRRALHRPAPARDARPHQEADPEGRLPEGARAPRLRALPSSPRRSCSTARPSSRCPRSRRCSSGTQVAAVVTQPDRPAGRGQQRELLAGQARAPRPPGSRCCSPPGCAIPDWPERLAGVGADVAVVVAFGQILPKAVLDVPTRGLDQRPRLAPAALSRRRADRVGHHPRRDGDRDHDVPDGPGHGHRRHAAAARRRPSARRRRPASWPRGCRGIGAGVLLRTLEQLDTLTPTPQDHAQATLAPRLKKEDGWLRLTEPARALVNRVRGCNPWPGAAVMTPAGRLLIWRAPWCPHPTAAPPGTLVATRAGRHRHRDRRGPAPPRSRCSPRAARRCRGMDFLRGARLGPGARLGELTA